jgi:hypothetical protein
VLAGLIVLALAVSFFHGCAFCADDTETAYSVVQTDGDSGSKVPAHPASAHCDHCLTHVASVATQDTAIAIAYGTHAYSIVSMRVPASADLLSPFEPPRA